MTMTIKQKVLALISATISVAAISMVVGGFTTGKVASGYEQQQTLENIQADANASAAMLNSAGRGAARFLDNRQPKQAEDVEVALAKADALIGEAADHAASHPSLRDALTEQRKSVHQLRADFQPAKAVANSIGVTSNDGLQKPVRQGSEKMGSIVGRADFFEASFVAALNRLVRSEADMFSNPGEEAETALTAAHQELGVLVFNSGMSPALTREFDAELKAYQQSLTMLVAARSQSRQHKTAIVSQAAKLEEMTKKAADLVEQEISAGAAATKSAITANRVTVIAAGLITLALCASVGWLFAMGILRPLTLMTEVMARLARDDMGVEVPATRRQDEIGEMARSVEVFKRNMIRNRELEQQKHEADQLHLDRANRLRDLTNQFDARVAVELKGLLDMVGTVTRTAGQLDSLATECSRQSAVVAQAAGESAADVQSVASASEELETSENEIARRSADTAKIVQTAVTGVDQADGTMTGLASAAQKIGEVVGLINDIAGQTNLLALNATIEAARAGESGKGFAVVANEVKSLANQTGKATNDIAEQVSGIQNATQMVATTIQVVGKTIREVNDVATSIAAAVEEQSAATREIARSVANAAARNGDVMHNIAAVSEAVGQTGVMASTMVSAAEDLSSVADRLRGQIDQFLTGTRAL